MVKRISDVSELQDSGFGKPWPRHGLRLLYWFADQCISGTCNSDMILLCDPARGDFGFHFFANRCNQDPSVRFLPNMKSPYYVVGNLNSPGADMLPDYVVKDKTRNREDQSNADRLIVCFLGEHRFGKVYVTTHSDLSNYDPRATFHITRTLLWIIKSYRSKEDFLTDTGYHKSRPAVANNKTVSSVWYYSPELRMWVPRLDQQVSPPSRLYNNDVRIQITDTDNDTETQSQPETEPQRKSCCERFCTIL
nr:uncharacterized protein LOC129444038 [Misgurnus anguillicaudatus]